MRLWVVVLFSLFSVPTFAEIIAESCACPKIECDPCHEQKGVTFYTEKCGDGDRVRSCAKPTCMSIEPIPAHCSNIAKEDGTKPIVSFGATPQRKPASAEEEPGKMVGTLAIVKGSVTIKDPSGNTVQIKEGMPVREKDIVDTTGNGQAQIKFNDGNVVHVREDSQMKVNKYDVEDKADKTAVLELLKGKIRNQVIKKYDGKQSRFEIKTKAAVAGVRGTDFVVSWIEDGKNITRIDAFEGEVKLNGLQAEESAAMSIKKNQSMSFVVDGKESRFTKLEELSEMEIAKLDISSRVGEEIGGRVPSSSPPKPSKDGICASPAAPFNSCLWKCINNPKGATTCRTDLPQVSCVRARCNANGEWAEETRLPASFHGMCPAHESTVAPCDY